MVTLGDSLEITQLATQCLPLELVLRIIELLVLDLRDHEPQRARLLSSISRTVRTGILPLVYEIVAFRIRDRQRVPAGWDGRSYEHPSLSFLSWLLCNPLATPRQYIQQLVFVHTDTFYPVEIRPDASITSTAELWAIDNLIVMYPSDMRALRAAGIVARRVHWLATVSRDRPRDSIGKDVLAMADSLRDDDPRGRHCVRIWTKYADEVNLVQENSKAALASWENAFRYHELDQDMHGTAVPIAPVEERGVTIFIDIGAKDGFGELSSTLLNEIASIFELDPRCAHQIVLVYPQNTMDKIIYAAARKLREENMFLKAGQEQLWIARSSLDRHLMIQRPHVAVARAFQLGMDPWEKGQRISEVSDD